MGMTRRQRQAVIRKLVSKWVGFFSIHYDILIDFKADCDEDDGQTMPQFLREEEKVVTALERGIVGERVWRAMLKRGNATGDKAMGECIDESAHYGRFKLRFYDALLRMEDDDDFMLFAGPTVLHECLHIVQWPLSSYCQTLEGK